MWVGRATIRFSRKISPQTSGRRIVCTTKMMKNCGLKRSRADPCGVQTVARVQTRARIKLSPIAADQGVLILINCFACVVAILRVRPLVSFCSYFRGSRQAEAFTTCGMWYTCEARKNHLCGTGVLLKIPGPIHGRTSHAKLACCHFRIGGFNNVLHISGFNVCFRGILCVLDAWVVHDICGSQNIKGSASTRILDLGEKLLWMRCCGTHKKKCRILRDQLVYNVKTTKSCTDRIQ